RDDQRRAAASEVPRIGRVFGDLPSPDEAHGVWVKEARKALPIQPPPKVGARVKCPLRRLLEARRPAERKKSTEDGFDGDVLDRQRRFAFAAPDLLIGIREQRIDDIPKTRSGVRAVLFSELFRPDVSAGHL